MFWHLFGSSAQIVMAFIFDINTNLNENNKEMSKLTDLRSQVDMYINWYSNSLA